MYQIYKITNKINNKIYIGSSIDVHRRWRHHIGASKNSKDHHYNYPLMQDFREYGIDNFTFEIISNAKNWEDMIKIEHDYIIKEDCIFPKGYN